MNRKIIFSIIYFILLYAILHTYFAHIFISPPEVQSIGKIGAVVSAIRPTEIIILGLSLILSFLIIFFVKTTRINNFLKPKKWKIIPTIIILIPALFLIYGKELGLFNINYYIIQAITFKSVIFSGLFEFMELAFPIIAYYIIVCLIYALVNRKSEKELPQTTY